MAASLRHRSSGSSAARAACEPCPPSVPPAVPGLKLNFKLRATRTDDAVNSARRVADLVAVADTPAADGAAVVREMHAAIRVRSGSAASSGHADTATGPTSSAGGEPRPHSARSRPTSARRRPSLPEGCRPPSASTRRPVSAVAMSRTPLDTNDFSQTHTAQAALWSGRFSNVASGRCKEDAGGGGQRRARAAYAGRTALGSHPASWSPSRGHHDAAAAGLRASPPPPVRGTPTPYGLAAASPRVTVVAFGTTTAAASSNDDVGEGTAARTSGWSSALRSDDGPKTVSPRNVGATFAGPRRMLYAPERWAPEGGLTPSEEIQRHRWGLFTGGNDSVGGRSAGVSTVAVNTSKR